MKAIVTVVGKDRVGIIASVCSLLAHYQVNILDISQTVMQGYFTMMMAVDTTLSEIPFVELAKKLDAKIVKLMTFGAFAEILPGVDGLIHISQIADKRIGKPEDVLAEGQEVQVKITDVDAENKRISLSIRALLEQASEEAPVEEA